MGTLVRTPQVPLKRSNFYSVLLEGTMVLCQMMRKSPSLQRMLMKKCVQNGEEWEKSASWSPKDRLIQARIRSHEWEGWGRPATPQTPCQERREKPESFYSRFWRSLFFFFFPGLHLQHMEVPWLGVESELEPPVYTTATATQDRSRVWDLHHSSRQHQISDPLSEVRERTRVLVDTSRIRFHCTSVGTPGGRFLT